MGIVVVLIATGVAIAVVDGGSSSSRTAKEDSAATATTEPALPSITNAAPPIDAQQTTTVDDCSAIDESLSGTSPAVIQPDAGGTGALGSSAEGVPELAPSSGMMGDNDPDADPFPGDEDPASSSAGTVTVDRHGVPCTPASGTPDASNPAPTTPTTPTTPMTPTTPTTPAISPAPTTPSPPTSPPPTTTPATNAPSKATDWPDRDGWTVVVFAFAQEDRANQRAADLQADGFEGGVLLSSDYGSLCPGFYVVFSGVYATKAQAQTHEKRLRGKYQGMYVKKIAKDGAAENCRT